MKDIGDNYYQFRCPCGEEVLLRGGDHVHFQGKTPLCSMCGKDRPTKKVGEHKDEIVCEICRKRMPPQEGLVDGFLPSIHPDGEVTIVCRECQMLDPEGEEWKLL
jgi:predicted RNA-binding Zn-ribbon protein involved in translation (DUF1610 family)